MPQGFWDVRRRVTVRILFENPFLGLAFRGGLCHTAVSSCRKRAGIEAAPLRPQTLPRFAR
jgi:hypothetical protein